MRLIGLLSFYDEDPELLRRSITGVAECGVTDLIALDGPYALYPHGGRYRSSSECLTAIVETAENSGAAWSITQTTYAWEGDEVGKRQEMMRLALGIADSSDWLLVFDADHIWSGEDMRPYLYNALEDFASVSFAEVFQPDSTPIWATVRPLMRARGDLHMGTNHYTYVTDDGFSTLLDRPLSTMPALNLNGVARVVHLVHQRDHKKRAKQADYYRKRDTLRIEL